MVPQAMYTVRQFVVAAKMTLMQCFAILSMQHPFSEFPLNLVHHTFQEQNPCFILFSIVQIVTLYVNYINLSSSYCYT